MLRCVHRPAIAQACPAKATCVSQILTPMLEERSRFISPTAASTACFQSLRSPYFPGGGRKECFDLRRRSRRCRSCRTRLGSSPRSRPACRNRAGGRSTAADVVAALAIVCVCVAPTTAPMRLYPRSPTSRRWRDRPQLVREHLAERPAIVELRRPAGPAMPGLLVRTSTNSPFASSRAVLTNGSIVSMPRIGLIVIASGARMSSCIVKTADRPGALLRTHSLVEPMSPRFTSPITSSPSSFASWIEVVVRLDALPQILLEVRRLKLHERHVRRDDLQHRCVKAKDRIDDGSMAFASRLATARRSASGSILINRIDADANR